MEIFSVEKQKLQSYMALLNGGNNFCGVDDREHAEIIVL
jgi:hypothetical protein